MIRFAAGAYWNVFHLEIARVLHDVSVWAEISGVVVDVTSGRGIERGDTCLWCWDFAVNLDAGAAAGRQLTQLQRYLWRVLPPTYDVAIEGEHLHVSFDARRQNGAAATAVGARGG
jgi:hypothetical protein